jgi:uncharacterized membrane protein YphA (DoxX/SURF4 family)
MDISHRISHRIAHRMAGAALGVPFVWLGYDAVSAPGARVAMAAKLGIPRPEEAVRLNGAAMVAGGVALVADVQPRAAALGLVASMVPTTLAGHSFWKEEDPQARKANRIQFLKNLGLMGGLLAVALRTHR